MISERTLRQWRKDALRANDEIALSMHETPAILVNAYTECQLRILRLTQELMDLHLMRKG
uniref:Uncharacterized protein n=1 Tax=viral metagenome TaxID=1070528 RepID=A0A6M3KYR5_9ZZZZ